MKKLFLVFFLLLIFSSNSFASPHKYKNMKYVHARAKDLNMLVHDYTFAMALSGLLSGTMLGLFLWKSK